MMPTNINHFTPKIMNDTPTYAMFAKMRNRARTAENKLTAVTEQLDEYKERYIKLAGKYAIEMYEITEQRDDLQMQLDSSCNAEELRQFRAERDRLAEEITQLKSQLTQTQGAVAMVMFKS